MLKRHTKAIAFCKENIKLSKAETIERLVEEFGYASKTAYNILREAETEKVRKNSRTKCASEGLKAYLDRLEVEEQKAYERKMLEKELDRPKFFF